MKKVLTFVVVITMCVLTLCGCESKEEREARIAREKADNVNRAYQEALDQYNDLKDAIDRYEYYQDRLG